jgi:hypothetical protein
MHRTDPEPAKKSPPVTLTARPPAGGATDGLSAVTNGKSDKKEGG